MSKEGTKKLYFLFVFQKSKVVACEPSTEISPLFIYFPFLHIHHQTGQMYVRHRTCMAQVGCEQTPARRLPIGGYYQKHHTHNR